MAANSVELPIIDLISSDRDSTAASIRQACVEFGFFYLINHGIDEEMFRSVFDESRKFFNLPLQERTKLSRKNHRGYAPLYDENHEPTATSKGDSKESFYIGPLDTPLGSLNQWPSEEILPSWRPTMEEYYRKVQNAGTRLASIIALSLELNEDYFEKLGALSPPNAFIRLLHYPGELGACNEEVFGASAHSDYGMITLLATDGVGGLQVCRNKLEQPRVWEDVHNIDGAFIVNIGDMMERWTNCLFRSTLHRVMPTGRERYSVAFFLDPNADCIVECLTSCCSESSPPRFPPIRSGDYLEERFKFAYGSLSKLDM